MNSAEYPRGEEQDDGEQLLALPMMRRTNGSAMRRRRNGPQQGVSPRDNAQTVNQANQPSKLARINPLDERLIQNTSDSGSPGLNMKKMKQDSYPGLQLPSAGQFSLSTHFTDGLSTLHTSLRSNRPKPAQKFMNKKLGKMRQRASRLYQFSMMRADRNFVCAQPGTTLGEIEPWQLNYHQADSIDFYCLRTYSTSKLSDNIVTGIQKDTGDMFSSGLFAHENSLTALPNRAVQFYSKYSMDQPKMIDEKEESKQVEIDFGDLDLQQDKNIQRVNLDDLARIVITNQEYEGRIDYIIFTKIEFYDSHDNLVAEIVSHNEEMVKNLIKTKQLQPKRQQLTFEEFIDLGSERVVGIKIGCLKTGIPTGMQFLLASFHDEEF